MDGKALKIIGLALSVIGAGVGIAVSIIDEKKLDLKVSEKVSEALENLATNVTEES